MFERPSVPTPEAMGMTMDQKQAEAKAALQGASEKELDEWSTGLDRLGDNSASDKTTDQDVDDAFANIEDRVPDSVRRMQDRIREAQVAESGQSGNFPVISEKVLLDLKGFGLEPGSDPSSVATAMDMKKVLDLQMATRLVEEAADGGQELAPQPFEHHWPGSRYDMHVREITPGEYFLMVYDKEAATSDAKGKHHRTGMVSRTFRLDDINNADEKRIYLDNLMGQFHTEMALADKIDDLDHQIAIGLGQGFERYRDEGSLEDAETVPELEEEEERRRSKTA
jgi:hypothetical protein